MIESLVTLFVTTIILTFLPLIFMSVQQLSQQFNDSDQINYLLFHQQLMMLYQQSDQVVISNHHIYCVMPDNKVHDITIFPDKIIKTTKNNHKFQGYSPMLINITTKWTIVDDVMYLKIQQGRQYYELKLANKDKSPR